MMDTKIVGVISFLIGAVAGSVATYFAVQNKFDKRFEQEIAEYKAGYVSEMDISKAGEDEDESEGSETDADGTDIPQSVIDSSARMRVVIREQGDDNGGVNERTAYNKQVAKEDYEVQNNDICKPYVITADDYYNPMGKMAEYTRVRVYYDTENGEVYDEDGNYFEDTDAAVGYFNLTGISEGNQDTIFVCNDAESRLYQVCSDDPTV